jgi:signal peptidase II
MERTENVVGAKRARVNDLFALLVVIIIVGLDQLTKNLVVQHLSPPESQPPIPIIGDYLSIYYIQNNGAAFSLFANNTVLALLIIAAVAIIFYLYFRMLNNGPLIFKLVFGMIIGGAAGNLIDRAIRGGYVVDFIWFRIPQFGYSFAIFNIADASISVGVFLLFVLLLIGGLRRNREAPTENDKDKQTKVLSTSTSASNSGALHTKEQDAQP